MEVTLKGKEGSLFTNKDFILILLGKLVSNLGNSVHSAAVAWFIMDLVGKNSAGFFMGIFGICSFIPMIVFGPFSGVFVDKLDRKKIIVGTDLIRGGLILILAVLTYFNIFPLPALFAITILSAFFGTFFNPAVDASIPNIVKEDDLTRANSINGTVLQLTYIAGAAISGFLYYSIGIVGVFAVNGLSFILSGISEMFINIPKTKKTKKGETEVDKSSFWKDFKDGVVFIKGQRVVLVLFSFFVVLNFLFGPLFQIVFPKTINFTLGMTAREYGILESIFPVGSIIGMVLLSIMPKRDKIYGLLGTSSLMHGVMMVVIGIPILPFIYSQINNTIVFIIFGSAFFIMGIFNALLNVPLHTVFQRMVPDEYRGRFFGMLGTLSQGIVPVGLAIMGVISDILKPSTIFLGSGIIAITVCIWMVLIPEVKKL